MTAIPIIDLARVQAGAGAADTSAIAGQLLDAFRGCGFAYIKNHGIPPAVIDEAFQRSRDFFALPAEAKAECARPVAPAHQRGYSRPSREKLSQMVFDRASIAQRRRVPDVKESFDMGRDDDAGHEDDDDDDDDDEYYYYYNVWSAEGRVPGFRSFWKGFYARMGVLEGQVLRLVGEGLRLGMHGGGVDGGAGADPLKPHADGHKKKKKKVLVWKRTRFVGVPHIPGTVVVNVGDLLMRRSNDLLRSTMHRIQNGKARWSGRDTRSPNFCAADKDCVVKLSPRLRWAGPAQEILAYQGAVLAG
ncbi:UPF0676 protein [Escovopsis weberi]|uniref:UPF0676 protein n=1 Tax=Escovopsis weberi TaxID=150374 RepID=A0A0M9VV44_ESCWE|nr:UPF0676 protein [Escovopsis weberi]